MKTIILTGGTGLIGKALTINLLKQGNKVVITSRVPNRKKFIFENKLEDFEDSFEILGLDYFSKSAIPNFVDKLIQLKISPDAIIHNARSLETLKIEKNGESSDENLLGEYKVGVIGPYLLNNTLLNSSIGYNLKKIIIISSIYGVVGPTISLYNDFNNQSPIQYGITKAAQIHLSKELAIRYADLDIRVNTVSYGGVEGRANEEFKKRYSNLTPLKAMLNLNEVIKPIDFLLSDGASGMTGHNLIVDKGWTLW